MVELIRFDEKNCLDIDTEDLIDRLDNAKYHLHDKKDAFITIVVDGANREDGETEAMAFLRRVGFNTKLVNETNFNKMMEKAVQHVEQEVVRYISTIYNLQGYRLYLALADIIGYDLLLMMTKE